MGSMIPLFRPDQVVAKTGSVLRDSIRDPKFVLFDEETNDACSSFDFTHWVMEPGSDLRNIPSIATWHVGWRHDRSTDLSWFLRLITSYISHTFTPMSILLSIPRTASPFGINPPFSGDTHRSSNRWLPPPQRTSWTRPPLLSSLGSRTWRRARLPNRWKTTSTNSNRLDDTCSSKSSALGSTPNAAYPLRSDPITSTPRSIWERTRLYSGSMNGPRNMPEATNNAFWRTSSWWTLRSSPTPRCTRAATVNNSLCCLCCFPWSNITWTPTILTSTNCFVTTAAQKLDRCYTQDDMSHQTNRQQSDRKPWTRTHLAWPWPNVNFEPSQEIEGISHQRGISPHRPNRPYHQTMPSSCTAGTPRHPSGSSYHSPRQAKTQMHPSILHTTGWQKLIHIVWQTRRPTGTPDTSLHHIQKPAGCYHRVTTEPVQEESRLGPFGPPGIPCHTSRHRSLDLGTTTTTTIGESLYRMGENQFHPHGNRPQQWLLGLHQSPRQHRTLERLPGGGAPEPTPTLHLSKHRVQLCHQSITLDQLDHTNQAGQIPLSQVPHRVSTMGWQRC